MTTEIKGTRFPTCETVSDFAISPLKYSKVFRSAPYQIVLIGDTFQVSSSFFHVYLFILLHVMGGFKTEVPVDRRFRPIPCGCHCLEQ